MKITVFLAVSLVLLLGACSYAADAQAKVDPSAPVNPDTVTVSITANATPVTETLTSLASQSRQKILVESTVKGKVTVTLKDVSLDAALSAVCKSTSLVWRKVYIDPKSELLDKPDRFAATLRLMAGLSFPDLVISGSSNSKIGVLCQQKQGVTDAQDKIVKDLGMAAVYLVSNDAVVAAKDAAKNTPVAKYTDSAKQQMDMFMKMTPEDKEQALLASLNMMDSVGSDYYASVMQTLMNTDPENVKHLMAKQTDMLFSMTPEQRRSMMKFNLQAMQSITPEQQKMLQEDAAAIMQDMKSQPQPGQ